MSITWPIFIDLDKSSAVSVIHHVVEGTATSCGSSASHRICTYSCASSLCSSSQVSWRVEMFIYQLPAFLVKQELESLGVFDQTSSITVHS